MLIGLIVVLYLIVFGKWLLFILLSPLYRRAKKKAKLRWIIYRESYYESQTNNSLTFAANVCSGGVKEKISKFMRPLFLWMGWFLKYMDFKIGKLGCIWVRRFIYKKILCVDLDDNAILHIGTEIRAHEKLVLKRGAIVGDFCLLDARNGLVMEENASLSSYVQIYTEQHDHRDPNFACNSTPDYGVVIGKRAWIGPGVIILPGVKIGEGAVVGAGAVVANDIPPFSVAVGIPAKKIGERNSNLIYEFNNKGQTFC